MKVTYTKVNNQTTENRLVTHRTVAPMRAVLKQVPGIESTYDESTDQTTITTVPGLEVEFPYGPVDVKYANIALNYSQIKRPGLTPLLVRTAPKLNTVTFTATIADKRTGGKDVIEDTLDILKEMAASDVDCEFIYGLSALPYRVRITKMDINSRYRNLEGQLTQANVSIQLTEAPEFDPLLGELTAVTPIGAPTPVGSAVETPEPASPDDPTFTPIIHIIVRQQDVDTGGV
jgi:hypothetical protein